MASPAVLDFDKLLAPIPGDSTGGVNLRQDPSPSSDYQKIKSAIGKARTAWRKRIEGDPESQPDWGPILDLAPEAIAAKSKDLEIAAWLIEALLQEHGFPGLRDGFRLARELSERFWDQLHPQPDEDGMGVRVAALAGLNGFDREGILIDEINNVPLTAKGPSDKPFVQWHYRQAANLSGITDPEKRQKRIDAGDVTREMLDGAEAATSLEFAQGLRDDLSECLEELLKLVTVLEERCGKDRDGGPAAPPTAMIRAALQECLKIVEAIAAAKGGANGSGAGPAGGEGAQAESGGEGGGAAGAVMTGGAIRNREAAFQALLQVARFFKQTEPHSPISYALERAVRWGKMPLPDLLGELIGEESARSSVFKLVGIPEGKPPGES
jgi:type VI secretion system protein ImpA